MDQYQIFISYRRAGAADLAGRIADQLKSMGYKVFFDVETMRSGKFNTQLFDAIDQSSDVIVVLPPHALERCRKKSDWLRQEIAYAIKREKNIIPIMMRGFKFPFFIPKDIAEIKIMEGIAASNDYFDAVIQKLEKLLVSNKERKEVTLDEEKLINGVYFGYNLATLELVWGKDDDLAQSQFKRVKSILDAENVPYETSNYHDFINSIIAHYRIKDTCMLYIILIGIFILRMSIYHDMKKLVNEEMQEDYYNSALSALSTIPSSFIKVKENFVNKIKEKIENDVKLPEIIQEIYRILS